MIQSALTSHPDCRCLGELPGIHKRYGQQGQTDGESLLRLVWQLTDRYQAGGFILHRDRYWGSGGPGGFARGVWSILCHDKKIRVILLNRRDHLARFASWKLAKETGEYAHRTTLETVWIDPVEFASDVQRYRRKLAGVRQEVAAGHRILEVDYEDVRYPEILDFLGLAQYEISPMTVKQETRPLAEVIENYQEIKGRINDI